MKVYHLSHKKNRNSIKKSGLIALSKMCGRIIYGPRVFVSLNMNTLAFDYVGYRDVDVWSFDIDETLVKKDEFSTQDSHYYVEKHIKKDQIKLVKSF